MTDVDPPEEAGDAMTLEQPVSDADLERAKRELVELREQQGEGGREFDARDAGGIDTKQRSLFVDAVRTFTHNRLALLAAIVMLTFVILAIFVPYEASWNPLYSHQIATGAPYGHKQVPKRDKNGKLVKEQVTRTVNGKDVRVSKTVMVTVDDPDTKPYRPMSLGHPFGTDSAGLDMWKRSWVGARLSLSIALSTALVILIIGVIYGSISGYIGGRLDNIMMRLLDSLYGLPYLPFAIITVGIVRGTWPGASPLFYMVPALSITTWFTQARVTRGLVLSLKENDFVESARASGAGWMRIIARHILPNTISITIVAIALEIPGAILGEAVLSYLGLGVASPETSWGLLANKGADAFRIHPQLIWVPALMIATTVLCAVAIADGLRDALDPRGKAH